MAGSFFHFLVIYSQFAGSVNQPLPPVSVVVPDLAPVAEDAMEEESSAGSPDN